MDDFDLVSISNSGEISVNSSLDESVEIHISDSDDVETPVTPTESDSDYHVDDSPLEESESIIDRIRRRMRNPRAQLIASNSCWGALCIILLILIV